VRTDTLRVDADAPEPIEGKEPEQRIIYRTRTDTVQQACLSLPETYDTRRISLVQPEPVTIEGRTVTLTRYDTQGARYVQDVYRTRRPRWAATLHAYASADPYATEAGVGLSGRYRGVTLTPSLGVQQADVARLVPGMQQKSQEELQTIVQSARRIADPTTGRYDITVSTGPSYQTKRQEAAESMMQFMQAMPETSQVVADLIAKAMDWPGSDEIAKRLKKTLPPGIAEDEDGEQQQQQAPNPELIKAQQDMQIKQAELQQKEAEAQREHQRKVAEMEMDAHIRLLEINAKHDTDYQKSQLDALTRLQQADIQARQRDNAQAMQEQTRERTEAIRARQQAQQNTGSSGGGSQRNQ